MTSLSIKKIPKNLQISLLEQITDFIRVLEYNINIQKSIVYLYMLATMPIPQK